MSLLTKIFVVIVTVLALLIPPLLVANVKSANAYKTRYMEVDQQLAAARNTAKLREADLDKLRRDTADQVQELNEQIAELETRNAEARAQLRQKEVTLVETTNQLNDVRARLGDLSSALDTQSKIIDDLKGEVASRRDQTLELERKNIELNDELQDTQTQLATAIQQIRQYREQISELTEANQKLAEKVEQARAGGQVAQATATQQPQVSMAMEQPVRGIITDVITQDSEMLAAVNIGSNDNVSEGMEFIIYEDGQFKGNLTITKVDMNSAAGVVTLARGEIRPNMQVLTGAGF